MSLDLSGENSPRTILAINVSRIGDTLLAVPALRALANAWPQARMTVLGHPKRVEVLEHLPFIDKVGSITKQRARFMGRLPGRPYDLALVWGHDHALIEYALRVSQRVVAFRQHRSDLDQRLYRVVEEAPQYSEHAVDSALRIPLALGIPPAGRRLQFALTEAERQHADTVLAAKGVQGRSPLIGLKVASFPTKAYRDWPEAHFIELCQRVADTYPGAAFAVFGGADEQERIARIRKALPKLPIAGLVGLSLREAGAVMACLDAYVGVDTGPTHIMGCFDIPIVGLFHCKLPRRLYGPLDHPYDFCLDHPRAGKDCDETTPMGELDVDTVFARLTEALASRGADKDKP